MKATDQALFQGPYFCTRSIGMDDILSDGNTVCEGEGWKEWYVKNKRY